MARMQRAAAALCVALVLSAAAVDGAGLWGGAKKDDKGAAPSKLLDTAKAATAASPKPTAIPSGEGHNVYWCAQ